MTSAYELKPLDIMTSFKLLLTRKNLGFEVKALEAMNSSGLGLK